MSECFLSRMDIVGYSNIYRADPKGMNRILEPIVKRLKSELSRYNKASGTNNGLRFHQMYGDTLDISFEIGENDEVRFLALLDVTCMIQMELTRAGLMVRGSIVRGDLIDNPRVFTGMAMVEAAAMEKDTDSPHLRLDSDAIEMLESSVRLLFPNTKDQKIYLQQTIYDDDKLDFFHHIPYVIPYDTNGDESTLLACVARIEEVSMKNIVDEKSQKTSKTMLKGLRRYCKYQV